MTWYLSWIWQRNIKFVLVSVIFFLCSSGESGPKIVSAMVGESLILITDFTIERGERVQWSFQDKTLAAGMNGDISKTAYGDVRFKGRLELHHQTGSLTIKNTRTSDTGDYQLKFLSRSGKVICWEFKVTVSGEQINSSEHPSISYPSKLSTCFCMLWRPSSFVRNRLWENNKCLIITELSNW